MKQDVQPIIDWIQRYINKWEDCNTGVLDPSEKYAIEVTIATLHAMQKELEIFETVKDIPEIYQEH